MEENNLLFLLATGNINIKFLVFRIATQFLPNRPDIIGVMITGYKAKIAV